MTSEVERRVNRIWESYAQPGVSAAGLLCEQHPDDDPAVTFIADDLSAVALTYAELRALSERCAAGLADLGVGPGDRVATLMGKSAELLGVMLGTWRLGAVYVPLFTAFGPQAIAMRLAETDAKVLVADADQRAKLEAGPDMPADAGWHLVVNGGGESGAGGSLAGMLAGGGHAGAPFAGGGDWPLVHMLTSGTTGRPKGVVHPLTYVAGWHVYAEYALDLRDEDSFWCAADPGWAYGLYTAILAPLAMGRHSHVACGGFSAPRTLRMLTDLGVTNFTAAPTVYRALRAADPQARAAIRLRCASSAGEPLTPEVNAWARDALGVEVHDHYGQTELGMCLGNHHHPAVRRALKVGSMGGALPGWSLAVLSDDVDHVAPTGTLGRIAVDTAASPLMTFTGYQHESGQSAKLTADGRWYLSGDAGYQDEDGDFFFSAREDDVIIMAGYRIGPFDVESVLSQHEAVAECAVIGVPDEARGEVLEAVVVTRPGHDPTAALARELQSLVKERYAAHAYPRSVHFAPALPKTESGKVQRVVLRAQRLAEVQAMGAAAT